MRLPIRLCELLRLLKMPAQAALQAEEFKKCVRCLKDHLELVMPNGTLQKGLAVWYVEAVQALCAYVNTPHWRFNQDDPVLKARLESCSKQFSIVAGIQVIQTGVGVLLFGGLRGPLNIDHVRPYHKNLMSCWDAACSRDVGGVQCVVA